jgi:hypothetical protein
LKPFDKASFFDIYKNIIDPSKTDFIFDWLLNNSVINKNPISYYQTTNIVIRKLIDCEINPLLDHLRYINVTSPLFWKITHKVIFNEKIDYSASDIKDDVFLFKTYVSYLKTFIDNFNDTFRDTTAIINDPVIVKEYNEKTTCNVTLIESYTYEGTDDFCTLIKDPAYKDCLFIFYDTEEDFVSQAYTPGKNNADIRPYQHCNPPRSSGIPLRTFNGVYEEITPHVVSVIETAIDAIVHKCRQYGYKRVIYRLDSNRRCNDEANSYNTNISNYVISQLQKHIR